MERLHDGTTARLNDRARGRGGEIKELKNEKCCQSGEIALLSEEGRTTTAKLLQLVHFMSVTIFPSVRYHLIVLFGIKIA